MQDKTRKNGFALAMGSLIVGVAATPVTAMVSIVLGIAMYSLSVYLIYKASDPTTEMPA